MFEVGSLVKHRIGTHFGAHNERVGVVLQQDNVASPAETQILLGENKRFWIHTRQLRLLSKAGKNV